MMIYSSIIIDMFTMILSVSENILSLIITRVVAKEN